MKPSELFNKILEEIYRKAEFTNNSEGRELISKCKKQHEKELLESDQSWQSHNLKLREENQKLKEENQKLKQDIKELQQKVLDIIYNRKGKDSFDPDLVSAILIKQQINNLFEESKC